MPLTRSTCPVFDIEDPEARVGPRRIESTNGKRLETHSGFTWEYRTFDVGELGTTNVSRNNIPPQGGREKGREEGGRKDEGQKGGMRKKLKEGVRGRVEVLFGTGLHLTGDRKNT